MITPRLREIINLIKSDSIADIGTDHAYIPIELARKGLIKKAVATDKNKGPIEIAEANVHKYHLENIIELRIGSGLAPIKTGEAKEIIIAGMGGKLIADIIEKDIETIPNEKVKKIVLENLQNIKNGKRDFRF